jgi:hypothetical protein
VIWAKPNARCSDGIEGPTRAGGGSTGRSGSGLSSGSKRGDSSPLPALWWLLRNLVIVVQYPSWVYFLFFAVMVAGLVIAVVGLFTSAFIKKGRRD